MSPMLIIYIICSIISGVLVLFTEWWDYRYGSKKDITLHTLIVEACFIFVPILNIIAIMLCVIYFFKVIAPNIVIVKRKK
jgi:hypothetical protein